MLGLLGIEFIERQSPRRDARSAGGGVTGNAVLTRFEPVATFRLPLPPCVDWERGATGPDLPARVRRRIAREPRLGQRFGLGAEFELGRHRLIVCSLHLEDKFGGVRGRWSQYMAAQEAVAPRCDASTVSVIAGDFNTFNSRLARVFRPESQATALGKPAGTPEAQWWKTTLLPPTGYADAFPPGTWTFTITPFFRAQLDWITTRGGNVRDHGVGAFASSWTIARSGSTWIWQHRDGRVAGVVQRLPLLLLPHPEHRHLVIAAVGALLGVARMIP